MAAVASFGARPYDDVGVAELAAAAEVTTGALYHHFGSKLGLYEFVREDVERRLLDRIEGAIAASTSGSSAGVMAALAVGFDFAVREGFLHLLDAPPSGATPDRLAATLQDATAPASPVLGVVLAAAWRAAVGAVGAGADPREARAGLLALDVRAV